MLEKYTPYNSQVVLKNKTVKWFLSKLLLIISLSVFLTNYGYAQQLSEAQIKSVYLYHFLNYIEWEHEPDIHQFVIGFLGEEPEMFDELKNMAATKKAKNKPIKVIKITPSDTSQKIQMLYVCASENYDIRNIARVFGRKNILLVTNQCDDKTSVMINFVYSEKDKVQFQINKPSIMQENLKLAPQVLLKGGTELDVAELYHKMEEEVFKSKNTIQKQQDALNELNNKLAIQNKEIAERENQLLNIQAKYNSISDSLLLLSREFESKKDALNSKEAEMALLLKNINEFTVLLNQQKEKIQSINLEIKEKEKEMLEQDKIIQEQSSRINLQQKKEVQQDKTIKSQHYINLIIILILIFVVIILIQYFLSSKKQKKTNKLISEQNHQLIQKANELKLAKDAAEAANKELEAFSYSVSHDLRAPLRHIDGFIELLQTEIDVTMDQQGQHYMKVISDSAKRMGSLIDDLLSFSRMGRNEMSKMQVDLVKLVQEVIREFEPEAKGRTINWQISNLPVVTGDRAMLRIVIVNLIANALKFTRDREQAEIEIGYTKDKETGTAFFVRDNGVGFDPNYANKLFGVFQRLHRADEFEGTGIGLANVRRIIARHGGKTWADSKLNQGATFYFSLP
jgi:signal transduction histidine kinase